MSRYDLTKINQDVLKGLYQQLVDPVDRHDLGEFYTPDWLAEMIIRDVIRDSNAKILDPACGSGTFVAAAIRHKIKSMKFKKGKKINEIVNTIFGIDVHPLAVLISKANFLMALGDLIKHKEGPITIPIYMADSILFPTPTIEVSQGIPVLLYPAVNKKQFVIPLEIVEKNLMEKAVGVIKDSALSIIKEGKSNETAIKNYLQSNLGISKESSSVLVGTIYLLAELIKSNKDTIYPFILRNIYKPSTLENFDHIIGNPPWLTYHDVRSIDRQKKLKEFNLQKYNLLDPGRGDLFTHMELATLFLLRCSDLFLKKNGSIAFVMPISVFSADHHHNLRLGDANTVGIKKIYDLEKVYPIFKLSSCVIIAKKGDKTVYPIPTNVLKGKLRTKNIDLNEVEDYIKNGKFTKETSEINLLKIGKRSAWHYGKLDVCGGSKIVDRESHYLAKFNEGATIVPRPFWFVEIKEHEKFGIDKNKPYLETSKRAMEMTKKQWKKVFLNNKVENEFLFSTLLASDLIPFSHLSFRPIVLPVYTYQKSFKIFNSDEIKQRGSQGLYEWVTKAENFWTEVRGEKVGTSNIYQWVNYRNKITNQNPGIKYRVIYSAIGTNMCACIVDTKKLENFQIKNTKIHPKSFVVDYSTIYFETSNIDEAYYLSSILNSKIVDALVKPFQAKGLWGERNLWKKPLEFPFTEFSSKNKSHRVLSKLGKECENKIKKMIPKLLKKYSISESDIKPIQTAKLRGVVRDILVNEITAIDEVVCKIFTK